MSEEHYRTYKDTQNQLNIEFFPRQETNIHIMLKDMDMSEIPQEIKDQMLLKLFKKVFGS